MLLLIDPKICLADAYGACLLRFNLWQRWFLPIFPGTEVMRFSPRQADCMIVAGTVTYKMAEVVRRIYEQMGDPKWVVAMGACASSGGMYRSYATLGRVDRVVQ